MFPGFLTPVLTQLFFPKPPTTFLTCFCRGERRNTPERKVASTGDRTHTHQVISQTRSPLSYPGGVGTLLLFCSWFLFHNIVAKGKTVLGTIKCFPFPITMLSTLPDFFMPPPRIDRSGAYIFGPSVCLCIRLFVRKNFYIGHIFWLVRLRVSYLTWVHLVTRPFCWYQAQGHQSWSTPNIKVTV